jgi:hypothetical protein
VAATGLSGLALLALPRAASACAVCFSGPDETRGAFLSTTVGMSVLPLALVGGIIWWLRRQVKSAEREEAVRVRDVPPGLRARQS